MTKEEIINASLEELTERLIDLRFERCNIQVEAFEAQYKLNRKDYKKLFKEEAKKYNQYRKEWNLILDLRPDAYFSISQIKKSDIKIPVPYPGIYIKDYLICTRTTISDFALKLGMDKDYLLLIIDGKEKITEELALKLSEVIGTSVEVWLNLQKRYDESLENKQDNSDDDKITIVNEMELTLEVLTRIIDPDSDLSIYYGNKEIYCGTSDPDVIFDVVDEKYLKALVESISPDLLDCVNQYCIKIVLKVYGGDK